MKKLQLLMAASECFPFARTGGLSEVVPSLAIALKGQNTVKDVSIVIPYYASIEQDLDNFQLSKEKFTCEVKIAEELHKGELFSTTLKQGVKIYFVKNEHFFKRDGIYGDRYGDYHDNSERFYFFSRFIVEMIRAGFVNVDILHVNDWHVSLVPAIIKSTFKGDKTLSKIKTLLTIHNLGYQGILRSKILMDSGFDANDFPFEVFGKLDGSENRLNFLKTGIVFADKINTVSPSYAKEILTPISGFGLEKLLHTRASDLSGILNGGNYLDWNPETDKLIPQKYSINNMEGKLVCKQVLEKRFKFIDNLDRPIIGVVARLTYQKGLDLIQPVMKEILDMGARIIILGNGDRELETFFLSYSKEYSDRVGVSVAYDIKLAHLIQAGSDIFLMPSRYEPCGLTQIYAMKYGTIPVVRATGGLRDTVKNFDETSNEGDGFVFENMDSQDMLKQVRRAIRIYENKELWNKLRVRAMLNDFSYDVCAKSYVKLYQGLIK